MKNLLGNGSDPHEQAVNALEIRRLQDPSAFRLDMAEATRTYQNARNQLGFSHEDTQAAKRDLELYIRANGGREL